MIMHPRRVVSMPNMSSMHAEIEPGRSVKTAEWYLLERKRMTQYCGDYLDSIEVGAKAIPMLVPQHQRFHGINS